MGNSAEYSVLCLPEKMSDCQLHISASFFKTSFLPQAGNSKLSTIAYQWLRYACVHTSPPWAHPTPGWPLATIPCTYGKHEDGCTCQRLSLRVQIARNPKLSACNQPYALNCMCNRPIRSHEPSDAGAHRTANYTTSKASQYRIRAPLLRLACTAGHAIESAAVSSARDLCTTDWRKA